MTGQEHDESTADLLRAVMSGAMVCLTRCWPCMCGQCPGGDHRWADEADIEHAVSIGKPETAEGRCGCPCTTGPVLDEAPDEDVELVSIGGPPCPACGAAGACGYDAEGRPYIHTSWDEDETEEIR